jgi:glycosyltransferase involved in cell wall biosynthesis
MRIRARVIYDVDGWAYHNRALALRKYAPADFAVAIAPYPRRDDIDAALGDEPADVVLLLPAVRAETVRTAMRSRGWETKLVSAWSYPWPADLAALQRAQEHNDWVVFINRLSWARAGKPANSSTIWNGVDREVFRVTIPFERRRQKVLWVGSHVYRELKGYDSFIVPLWSELRARGIACEALLVDSRGSERRSPSEMCDWYNGGTVLVCASACEGTPNPVFEAAACGCTVVSTRVGNVMELVRDGENGFLAEQQVDALASAVQRSCADYPRLARRMQTDIAAWDWRRRSAEYFALFRKLLSDGNA